MGRKKAKRDVRSAPAKNRVVWFMLTNLPEGHKRLVVMAEEIKRAYESGDVEKATTLLDGYWEESVKQTGFDCYLCQFLRDNGDPVPVDMQIVEPQ